MPKDHEWAHFMSGSDQFVDPSLPVRSAEDIIYPGRDHEACQEVRAGLLERKSKYLKSYTAGWYGPPPPPRGPLFCSSLLPVSSPPWGSKSDLARYVLSPTHLHEFKSADKGQAPVMSLYLPEQKLGSHSQEGGSSQKFILKGRQTGGMHRGHTWVFRAESHDTMMAWYADLKVLTERSAEERNQMLIARGLSVRSGSGASRRSTSSDAGVVDEEDEEPFAAGDAVDVSSRDGPEKRPQAGGRFPSDIQVNAQRGVQVNGSPSTASSGLANGDGPHATGPYAEGGYGDTSRTRLDDAPSNAAMATQEAARDGVNPYTSQPLYHPAPIHGAAPAAAIYQYQTPGRESIADGAGYPPATNGGSYFAGGMGPGAAAGYAAGQAGQAGRAEQTGQVGQAGQYGVQDRGYAPPGETSLPSAGAGAQSEPREGTVGEQLPAEDEPRQGTDRTSTSFMHVPGGYPKSATNLVEGNGVAR